MKVLGHRVPEQLIKAFEKEKQRNGYSAQKLFNLILGIFFHIPADLREKAYEIALRRSAKEAANFILNGGKDKIFSDKIQEVLRS